MRLDVFLTEHGFVRSRTEAKNRIETGEVSVGGKVIRKPAYDVSSQAQDVTLCHSGRQYVSRGGKKLEAAIGAFALDVHGKCALDIGASGGGFTDCLLQHGAARVCAVDVGCDQLAQSLRTDARVHVIEHYNARYMIPQDLPFVPDIAVMDVSFISATCLIQAVAGCLPSGADFICLVKPQFEVGREHIGKGGIVKEEKYRHLAVDKVSHFAVSHGFSVCGAALSPIAGGDGNMEYLLHLRRV